MKMKYKKLQRDIVWAFLFNDSFENRNKAAEYIIKENMGKGNKTDIYEELNKAIDITKDIVEIDGKLVFGNEELRYFFNKLRPLYVGHNKHLMKKKFYNILDNMNNYNLFFDTATESHVKSAFKETKSDERLSEIGVKYYKTFKDIRKRDLRKELK